jgi:hypothetical protein
MGMYMKVLERTGAKNKSSNFSPRVPSMSTWGSIYWEMKGRCYNVCNAPIQPLHYYTTWSRGHHGPLIFTNVSMPNKPYVGTCPLLERLCPEASVREASSKA